MVHAGAKRRGSSHLFQHAAATLMLEGDVSYVQELLGHSKLESTRSTPGVDRGAEGIHGATHPGARLQRAAVAETQTPPLRGAARGAAPAGADAGASPLAAAVAAERADLLVELDAEGAEEGEA